MSLASIIVANLNIYSFDRYRAALKGTWKDKPLPAAGQTFDLGAHLIDQTLTLFGKPEKLTAFIQNVRGLGSPEVDDTVRMKDKMMIARLSALIVHDLLAISCRKAILQPVHRHPARTHSVCAL